jgi:hypothetical protein
VLTPVVWPIQVTLTDYEANISSFLTTTIIYTLPVITGDILHLKWAQGSTLPTFASTVCSNLDSKYITGLTCGVNANGTLDATLTVGEGTGSISFSVSVVNPALGNA